MFSVLRRPLFPSLSTVRSWIRLLREFEPENLLHLQLQSRKSNVPGFGSSKFCLKIENGNGDFRGCLSAHFYTTFRVWCTLLRSDYLLLPIGLHQSLSVFLLLNRRDLCIIASQLPANPFSDTIIRLESSPRYFLCEITFVLVPNS